MSQRNTLRLWRAGRGASMAATASARAVPEVPMPQLIVMMHGVKFRHVRLHKDRTTLGRRPDNDIALESMAVSGAHCVFDLVGVADVFVRDLGSTNGTCVNNRFIREPTLLHDGDRLAIGPYRLQFLQACELPSGFGTTTQAMALELPAALPQASFQVVSGSSSGLEVPVLKAVTTFGKPGRAVVSVAHRRTGFFVAHLAGGELPLLNGQPLGPDPVLLSDRDILELAGTRMLFQLRE